MVSETLSLFIIITFTIFDLETRMQRTVAMDSTDAFPSYRTQENTESENVSLEHQNLIMTEEELLSEKYKMDYPKRGTAIIINNSNFKRETRKPKRYGSAKDEVCMHELLRKLAFQDIRVKTDRTCAQMKGDLKAVAELNHSSFSCFVCVILSYGEEGYVYGTDDKISVDKLFEPFKGNNCQQLAGKPKLFIIQACCATEVQYREESDAAREKEEEEDIALIKIPSEADFLTVYSEVPGHFGWESDMKRSWFIQSLSEAFLDEWENKDVLTILTRVLRKMDIHLETLKGRSKSIQIPCITSMLTKSWFFK